MIIVEYEIGLLTNEIEAAGFDLPEDYENKSVAMEWSTQNNDGVETSQTKLFMEIEF